MEIFQISNKNANNFLNFFWNSTKIGIQTSHYMPNNIVLHKRNAKINSKKLGPLKTEKTQKIENLDPKKRPKWSKPSDNPQFSLRNRDLRQKLG